MPCYRHIANDGVMGHVSFPAMLSSSERLTVLLLLCIPFFLSGCKGPQSILDPASPAALAAAQLWWGMATLFTVVFIGILILWLHAVRPKAKVTPDDQTNHLARKFIWGGGILLPAFSIVLILGFGIPAGYKMLPLLTLQKTSMRINVIGHQWWWEVHYPATGVTIVNELHLPAGEPVIIYATSRDVIHSFWVPRLNGKIDMIPGYTNILKLQASLPGHYRGQCAEFCGENHAYMILNVEAHEPEAFHQWMEKKQEKPPLKPTQTTAPEGLAND